MEPNRSNYLIDRLDIHPSQYAVCKFFVLKFLKLIAPTQKIVECIDLSNK